MKILGRKFKEIKRQFKKDDLMRVFLLSGLILLVFWMGWKGKGLLGGRGAIRVSGEGTVTAVQLNKLLKNKDFIFINVHTPYEGEFQRTDAFIEKDSLKANKAKLPKDKDAKIVLYCKTGRMSEEALKTLKLMGYKNVYHLAGGMDGWKKAGFEVLDLSSIPSQVLPDEGFELPVSWGDILPRLVEMGVIDKAKFEKVVAMGEEEKAVFEGKKDLSIKINSQNSQFVVDALWALGLAQKSLVYEEGPMGKQYKKEADNFASTGGWTLAKGDAMNYYNKFEILNLTDEEQKRVFETSSNVYRPCCGNSTAFPDCNHGMAALAAIELMVKKGLPDEEIYRNVLKLNSFWFPSHYLTVATYFARQGISWNKVDAKTALSQEFSSGQAASKLYQEVGPLPFETKFGGSCGA